MVSSPVNYSEEIVIIGSYNKCLCFFNLSGEIIGIYPTKGKIFSTPVVLSNKTIVVCSTNGIVEFIKIKGINPDGMNWNKRDN